MVKYIFIILICIFIIYLLFITLKYENSKKMFMYNLCKCILRPLFKLWYPYKVINKEVTNIDGPVIFCGNHIHLMDQCLPILVTKRPIHYMAKIEYFQNPKTKWFFKMVGCIPVNRSIHDANAKDLAIEVLENNYALGLFPEGTRNKTKELLQPFKFGSVSMAKKTNATIIPFAITGDYKWRTKNLTLEFGKPFKVGNMTLEEANDKLYNEILSIIKKNKN